MFHMLRRVPCEIGHLDLTKVLPAKDPFDRSRILGLYVVQTGSMVIDLVPLAFVRILARKFR